MNVHEFIGYRFEKTSASKSQQKKALDALSKLEGLENLTPEQEDRLARARMVRDRQLTGRRVGQMQRLVSDLSTPAGKAQDQFGIRYGAAKGELDRARKRGKQIGDAKRAGKITVQEMVDTQVGRIPGKLKTMDPKVKDSGLTSKIQPTTRAAMGKKKSANKFKTIRKNMSSLAKKLLRR